MQVKRSKLVVTAVAACVVAGVAVSQGQAQASPRASQTSSSSAQTQKVIVLLKDQLSALPANRAHISARAAKAGSEQSAVLSRLSGPAATHVKHFALGNAFAAQVTASQVAALRANPSVASVVPDVSVPMTGSTALPAAGKPSPSVVQPSDSPTSVCPSNPAQPLVEPEALQSIHALTSDGSPNAQQLSTGAGVKVAYIADGIDPDNPNFIRPNGEHVITDYEDFSGDGPDAPTGGGEAFGDASAIAAQGTVIYDLSQFVNQAHPLPPGCNIKIVGVAPDASIVAIKAGGEFLTNSSILQSIDYAVRVAHVDVINESFGLSQFPDDSSRNTIKVFNDAAVASGVTITESSGDGGVTGTIGSDAQDPAVISVGATTDFRLYAQTAYAAFPFSNGKWLDDNISALSSSGVTQFGRTIDLVAPGEAGWATCEASPDFASCVNFQSPPGRADIEAFGGTSQSAPLTAGVAALVISAYRSTHGGASPSPAVVKQIITGTAGDLGLPPDEQGSGLLNARAATEAALTWPGGSGAPELPANIVTSTDQVTVDGLPNSTQTGAFTVTNVGTSTTAVAGGTRGFQKIAETAGGIAFNSSTLPQFTYYNGAQWAYKKVTFSVPAGAARLVTHIAWAGSVPGQADRIVRLTLLAPDGTFAANSRPQGGVATANYANVDVRNPAPGAWTAVLYSAGGATGYTGTIGLDAQSFRSVPFGSVSPSVFTLAPGASRTVHYSFTMPSTSSGDQTYAITLADSAGRQTAVGAVVRTSVDLSSGTGTFTGLVTGGNARAVTPGETFSYDFRVPANEPSLDTGVRFKAPPQSIMDLVLIDPNGELADVVSNLTLDTTKTRLQERQTMQSFIANPVPGTWHAVVVVQNPVSGTMFSNPFTGTISFAPVPVDRGGLPNSTDASLTRGAAHTFTVAVTNNGNQPIAVGVDPRTTVKVNLQPVPIQGQSTFDLPVNPADTPIYNVPPDTQSLTVTAVSTTPAQLELQGSAAGFDLFGDLAQAQAGNLISSASVSESGPRSFISHGIWFTNMQQIGPFTDDGAPAGSTTITASMHTLGFDHSVTTSTGDPFGNSVDPNNNGFGNPVRINPGDTKMITVTITPTAAAGTNVAGILNLVTVPNLPSGFTGLPQVTTGGVIAVLPYSYHVVTAAP